MKTRSRHRRNEAELRDAAGHVAYEVQMLCFIADNHPPIVSSPPVPEFESMALESFLVHYRNVRDFLFPTKSVAEPDPEDQRALDSVLALDFNQGWGKKAEQWEEVVPGERDRINKQLSHISYSRSKLDPQWPLYKMKSALVQRFKEFLDSLPDEKRQYFSQVTRWLPGAS